MFLRKLMISFDRRIIRKFTTGMLSRSMEGSTLKNVKQESDRMKKFRDMLKTEIPIDITRLNDPVLIDINPESGEFIPESEKEPTKWGDWQHGGRVSDF